MGDNIFLCFYLLLFLSPLTCICNCVCSVSMVLALLPACLKELLLSNRHSTIFASWWPSDSLRLLNSFLLLPQKTCQKHGLFLVGPSIYKCTAFKMRQVSLQRLFAIEVFGVFHRLPNFSLGCDTFIASVRIWRLYL